MGINLSAPSRVQTDVEHLCCAALESAALRHEYLSCFFEALKISSSPVRIGRGRRSELPHKPCPGETVSERVVT